ncbi:MAG: DUF1565 domain-containing protein, partial [Nanoarchaeota archaeon]|nr:DUF1565 domain-containing protein [Nanoarchaeota archaeon]
MKKTTFWLFFLMINLYCAASANYYVSTIGSDSNPGTQTLPWKTIQKAANTMIAGDTAIVLEGNYSERVNIGRSGSLNLPITFQSQGTVVNKGFSINANYIIIKNFEITNTEYVNYWSYSLSSGIFIKGASNVIENNYIHDASLIGIFIYGTPSEATLSHDNVIRNNRLYRNQDTGINLAGRDNLIIGNEIWDTVQCHPLVMAVESCEGANAK